MTLSEQIILECIKKIPTSENQFNALKREINNTLKLKQELPDKTELLLAYHNLVKAHKIKPEPLLEKVLTRRGVRTLSGVTVVTSLVKPYPCPGECVYCPLDERMPKSYLAEEPAAMRALMLEFDPYEQMARRLEALENNGHPTDKVELIIKGGTWNSYPLAYQYWFIMKSFEACNVPRKKWTKSKTVKGGPNKLTENSPLAEIKKELFKQQKINEKAKHRIIGLTLETRPDCVNNHTIWCMREMGTTRIELGIQHTDNEILDLTKRGHSAEQAKQATELLRNYGFKTDFHLMPQLPGSTPEKDLEMMQIIFSDPGYKPDMIKIYPCTVVKNSELYDWFEQGKYHAYSTDELIRIIKIAKADFPRYVRVSRLIRDIPGQYIEEGNKVTNLRQVIQEQMKKEGKKCKCLRCREVGHVKIDKIEDLTPHFFVDEIETQGGMEYFLSFEDKLRQVVFAFCRLRIVNEEPENPAKKINYHAFIRELHTYGQLLSIGVHNKDHSQHKGLGKKLIIEAEKIVLNNKIKKLAVISGVGVRDYYRKNGYRLQNTYMVKYL
jgi:elongator complex protein 3